MTDDNFKELREFSQELLSLGKTIEENFLKKQEFEDQIKEREIEIRRIQKDIFDLKSEKAKVEMELQNLEEKRASIEKKKDKKS
jgi:septal ring factor EnvC (AmiA/AmiB activator)